MTSSQTRTEFDEPENGPENGPENEPDHNPRLGQESSPQSTSHDGPRRMTDERRAAREILAALTTRPRSIPSKYFYDARGSDLFERITHLEEYYPSRTEKGILRANARALVESDGLSALVELGSGDGSKISILLEAAARSSRDLVYIPVDVSEAAIRTSCSELLGRFPGLRTRPFVGDFTEALDSLRTPGPKLVCFFGSTIGNLTRSEAQAFLTRIGSAMKPGERLLLGLDMVKDRKVLERAYHDAQGVTEAFNKNILLVANSLAGTNFVPDDFEHRAFFDEREARIEMQLLAKKDTLITAPGLSSPIPLARGEAIHTEYSHKFTAEHIERFAQAGGFAVRAAHSDPKGYFNLVDYVKPL